MKLYWLIAICFFASCKQQNRAQPINDSLALKPHGSIENEKPGYEQMKASIALKKKTLLRQYQSKVTDADLSQLQKAFVSVMVDSLFPYWYGTPWDFNGTSQKPGEGSIACGYFITTLLQDAGVPIRRVKLAQCASQEMIYDLVKKNPKKVFSNAPIETFVEYIREQGFGLSIVGLDAHVGFLYNDGSEVFFIHAKWVNPRAVVKEIASQSEVLYHSAYKIVGKISDDVVFLKRWVGLNSSQ
ncbi:MAG: hypothetical protein V4722_26290 [Bacteroidota bacterium]